MMKIIVIGILYNLLLQNNAAGEPTVKVQMCSDMFYDAINKCQNQIEQFELKNIMGDFEKSWVRLMFERKNTQTRSIPITSIELNNSKGCKILSNNSLATTFETKIEYGEKSSSEDGKTRSQNSTSYLFLNMKINTNLSFEVTGETINFNLSSCTVYMTIVDNNQKMTFLDPWETRQIGSKQCRIVRRVIRNMNVHWKGCFNIDPSGSTSLLLKDVIQNLDCVQFHFNPIVDNSEVISEQKHDILSGSCMSILKDHFTTIILTKLSENINKALEEIQLLLSPDEMRHFIPDMEETDDTNVKCHMLELTMNPETNAAMVVIQIEGFSLLSDKLCFQADIEEEISMSPLILDNEKMKSQLVPSGDAVISNSECHVGDSDNLVVENLHPTAQKIMDELMHALIKLQNDCGIPFGTHACNLENKAEAHVMQLSTTPQTVGPQND